MTDKLIEQIKTEKQEGPVEDDVATVMSEYLNAMEDRILADADVIKAAEVMADHLGKIAPHKKDGEPHNPVYPVLYKALAAFRQAQDRAALAEMENQHEPD